MNYRHIYHAGNFADVFKHLILTLLLKALARKDAPFVYIDTHAGAGRYDLHAPEARKTAEYHDGIGRLWGADNVPAECADYLEIVRALNPDGVLRHYPGSPWIAHALRRGQDRLVLAECEPQECRRLETIFAPASRVSIDGGDGLARLKAWLPPGERRGLVFVDPAYERDAEWDEVAAALGFAYRRWPRGSYAVWYPIKARAPATRFMSALAAAGFDQILRAELTVQAPDTPFRLNGCGVVMFNPPWRVGEGLEPLLGWLAERLRRGALAGARVEAGFSPKSSKKH